MPSSKEWSPREFDALVTGLMSGGGWFCIHRGLLKKLGMEAAVFLHFLINYHSRVKQSGKYKWDDGWFYCTVDTMEKELGVPQRTQIRALKFLMEDGLLEFKNRGLPAKRHVRINTQEVARLIAEWGDPSASSEHESVPTSDYEKVVAGDYEKVVVSNRVLSKKTRSKERVGGRTARTHKSSFPNGKSPSLLTTEFDRQAAGRLREILVINDSDLVHPPRSVKIDTLTKQFTVLRTQRGVAETEIKGVLKWLRSHYGEAMTPKIYKVEQIQTEWGRIRDAKNRYEEAQTQDGPVGREWDPDKDQ